MATTTDPAELLSWAEDLLRRAGVERPRLEAQLLLADATGVNRALILAGLCPPVGEEARQRFLKAIGRRRRRVPMAYIRGYKDFYGLRFRVSEAVLIPRPETEFVVECVLRAVREFRNPVMVDVGTGSGCIAAACAANASSLRVVAVDLSREACIVAAQNCARNRVSTRVRVVQGDLLSAVRTNGADIVAANPPYIPTGELGRLQEEVRVYEPRMALDGGPDGLQFHRQLIRDSLRVLRPGGMLVLEAALGQAPVVADLMRGQGYDRVEVVKDYAGIERVISGRKPASHDRVETDGPAP